MDGGATHATHILRGHAQARARLQLVSGCGLLSSGRTLMFCAVLTQEAYSVAKQYSSPPAMQIDPNKHYDAVFHTQRGDFTVELFARQAPITVNNFVFLAREGFYNNTTFHRVLQGFMAQA